MRRKAEGRAKTLHKKLNGILDNLGRRPRLPDNEIDYYRSVLLKEELFRHMEAIGGKKLRRTKHEIAAIAEAKKKLEKPEPEDHSYTESKPRTVEVPLMLKFDVDAGMIADQESLLNAVKSAFTGEPGSVLDETLKEHPYLSQVLNPDSDDPIELALPRRVSLPRFGPRKHKSPPNLKKIEKAVRSKFRKQKFAVEWWNGTWIVTIPDFYPDSTEAVFRALEDEHGGVAGTGISFQAL